jgi:flagella basal body P-ring formation protein FlgA
MTPYPTYRFIIAILVLSALTGLGRAQATTSQTLNSGWLLETAKNTITTNDPWDSAGCVVEITSTPADITIYRDGQIEVFGVLERTPNSLRDIGAVNIEVYVGGELYLRFDPTPYLSVSVNVYQAARDMDRDEVFNEDDIIETLTEVRNLPSGDMYDSPDEIIGMAARMNIQAGRIITEGMIEEPTVVFRGETVTVFIRLGNAFITLHGIPLDSGGVGDEIRVRNPDSNAIITATVTGPSRAEIVLD